jgi:hypothetical protein
MTGPSFLVIKILIQIGNHSHKPSLRYNVLHSENSFSSTTCPTPPICTKSTLYRSNRGTPILADRRSARAMPTLTGMFALTFVMTSNNARRMVVNYNGCSKNMTNMTKMSILFIDSFTIVFRSKQFSFLAN